jgi:hypothetical protein
MPRSRESAEIDVARNLAHMGPAAVMHSMAHGPVHGGWPTDTKKDDQ